MILWWMDKGVGGFRLDVIDQIAKEPDLEITANGPMLHAFIREMSRETFQKGELITVGEAWGADVERAKLYSNPNGNEFSMVFQFEHIGAGPAGGKREVGSCSAAVCEAEKGTGKMADRPVRTRDGTVSSGTTTTFRGSYPDGAMTGKYRVESAKMLAALLHGMQGTPYIYQGEELGMTNVKFADISHYRDIESLNMYKERIEAGYDKDDVMKSIYARGRDNARTPMQWDGSANAGFTAGTPWIRSQSQLYNDQCQGRVRGSGFCLSFLSETDSFKKRISGICRWKV